MRAVAAGAVPIRPELTNYFYGLLMFDVSDGKLCQSWDATSAVIKPEAEDKGKDHLNFIATENLGG